VPLPKIRNLGQYGVITDLDPYDLPTTAFSFAKNVRFRNNRVSSAPVFKMVKRLGTTEPRFTFSAQTITGQDFLFVCYKNGRVSRYSGGAETDYSISGYTDTVAEGTWTNAYLGDMIYVNRDNRVPWVMGESNSQFVTLPNWDPTWTCKLLRAVGGALVALNVTKAGITTQTMVKTSAFAQAGSAPYSWDQTDPATNASENILADLEGPITDACGLGQDLIIYGLKQGYRMTADFGGAIWDYIKLPFQKGALNANCSIEVNSQHYVFGPNDMWMHDGVSERSICDQRVREFVFGSANMSKANRFYVVHNPKLNEVSFCYVSGDAYTAFVSNSLVPDGCNRRATYNYATDTWTFDDLPLTYAAAQANLDSTLTYATATITYDQAGGSYLDQEDTAKRVMVEVGNTAATYGLTATLYAYDVYGQNAVVNFSVDAAATSTPYLERTGIDLDEIGADLQGYKQINYLVPQGRIDQSSTATLDFSLGAADEFNQDPWWEDWQSYDGKTNYKIDSSAAGKYLAMRIRFLDYKPFTLSGYDLSLQVTGTQN